MCHHNFNDTVTDFTLDALLMIHILYFNTDLQQQVSDLLTNRNWMKFWNTLIKEKIKKSEIQNQWTYCKHCYNGLFLFYFTYF